MRNRMVFILGAIILLFLALYLVVDYKNKQTIEKAGNPYGKERLKQETIDQLDDPLYQNQIIPDDLAEKLSNEEDVVVYFYSPVCSFCLETTPILVPLAEELNIDMKKLNLYEFPEEKDTYNITGTPTLIYYQDGKEVDRVIGAEPKEVFQNFFETYVLNNHSDEN